MPELIPQLVSTIIPVYNRPQMLRAAVFSVLNQTYRPIEIIIADDASTDDTPETGRELERQHPGLVRFVRSTENSGSGPGPMRELGRLRARGEFLQYLDSDDRLLPNKFTDQVRSLREHPECAIAYGLTRLADQDGRIIAAPFKWTGRNITSLFPGLLVDRWWCTHTPLYRRSVTDAIGPWCDMRWSQDWEYDCRAGAMQVQLVSCGTYVSEHVQHTGERQTSAAAWGTDPVRLRNRVALMHSLWWGADVSGVMVSAPERQHFARWCFRIARQCAAAGLDQQTDECLQLATESAGPHGPGQKGIAAFRMMQKIFGTTNSGRFIRLLESFKRSPGKATMLQSFAGQAGSPSQ